MKKIKNMVKIKSSIFKKIIKNNNWPMFNNISGVQ